MINWKEAPEGATHFDKTSGCYSWLMKHPNGLFSYYDGEVWVVLSGTYVSNRSLIGKPEMNDCKNFVIHPPFDPELHTPTLKFIFHTGNNDPLNAADAIRIDNPKAGSEPYWSPSDTPVPKFTVMKDTGQWCLCPGGQVTEGHCSVCGHAWDAPRVSEWNGELFTPHEGASIPSVDYAAVRKMIKAGYRKHASLNREFSAGATEKLFGGDWWVSHIAVLADNHPNIVSVNDHTKEGAELLRDEILARLL